MVWQYSALRNQNDRARFARELPDGDAEEWSADENRRWRALRRVAAAALAGRAPNPAPGADHWGSRKLAKDLRRAQRAIDAGRWVLLQTPTRNAFYSVVR